MLVHSIIICEWSHVKTERKYHIKKKKKSFNFIFAASFRRAGVYLYLDFQTKNVSFDRNKRDMELFHSF